MAPSGHQETFATGCFMAMNMAEWCSAMCQQTIKCMVDNAFY